MIMKVQNNLSARGIRLAIVLACAFFVLSLVFGGLFLKISHEKNDMQAHIDEVLTASLLDLRESLYQSELTEDARGLDVHGRVCNRLLDVSSYKDNADLQGIMKILTDRSYQTPENRQEIPNELIQEVGYVLGHMDTPEGETLAKEAFQKMEKFAVQQAP
jgi:hypothetical protein